MKIVDMIEWLLQNDNSDIMYNIFGVRSYENVLELYNAEEIIDKIERCEAEKNFVPTKIKFKQGDIIRHTGLNIVSRFKSYTEDGKGVNTTGNDCWSVEYVEIDNQDDREFKVGDWVEYSIFYYGKKYHGTAKILEIGQAEITGNVVYGIMLSEIDKVVFASANELKHLIFKVGDHVREIPAKQFEFDVVKVEGNHVYFSENNSIEAKYLEHAEPPKEEKQVDKTSDVYRFAEWCYLNGINFSFMSTDANPTPKRLQEIVGRYESEIGKPKEEKQKIEPMGGFWIDSNNANVDVLSKAVFKIQELVDAVNELRGAE